MTPPRLLAENPPEWSVHYRLAAPEIPFQVIKKSPFEPVTGHLNFGFDSRTLWIRIHWNNTEERAIERVLVLDNPLLEEAVLYDGEGPVDRTGLLVREASRRHLAPAFFLTLPPLAQTDHWIRITNQTTTMQLDLGHETPDAFLAADWRRQSLLLVLVGAIGAFLVLSLLLYLFFREKTHLFYAFYLATLLYQQLTYIGLLPLYAPHWFVRFDDLAVVPKLVLLIVAAALYGRSFLETDRRWKDLDRGYLSFIFGALVLGILTGWPGFYVPEAVIVWGLLFVLFNLYAGAAAYRRGFRAARFFLAAWTLLSGGYIIMILDALGFVSLMYRLPALILFSTLIEAVLLMLAMVDRYNLYRRQKEKLERRYLQTLTERHLRVESLVKERTEALRHALKSRDLLFLELHHRVKNNLQLIVSLIRLQKRSLSQTLRNPLEELENRIAAMARSHEILCDERNFSQVGMRRYLEEVIRALLQSSSFHTASLRCESGVHLALREAVYVGLVVNELVTNILKHSLAGSLHEIVVSFQKETENYRLEVSSDAKAAPEKTVFTSGLGNLIVETLVVEQLGGTLAYGSRPEDPVVVRFPIEKKE